MISIGKKQGKFFKKTVRDYFFAKIFLMKKLALIILVCVIALMLPAQSLSAGSTKTVSATNYQFSPAFVKIKKGSSVKWLFKEGAHNVVGKGWGSKVKSSGSYTKKFTRAGKYSYVCTLHPGMKGVVSVKK
jgi:plastocyanin